MKFLNVADYKINVTFNDDVILTVLCVCVCVFYFKSAVVAIIA